LPAICDEICGNDGKMKKETFFMYRNRDEETKIDEYNRLFPKVNFKKMPEKEWLGKYYSA